MPAPPPATRHHALLLHLNYAVPRRGIPAPASFRKWVSAALRGGGRHKQAELSIRLVGVDEGRMFNATYRDKSYPTNVLSFPAELPHGIDLPLLGDLVICTPVVAREANEQGKPLRHHWAHLTMHGILHLLGYNHVADAESKRMETLETRILADFGIPDPYHLLTAKKQRKSYAKL